jgi:hypothetical protein
MAIKQAAAAICSSLRIPGWGLYPDELCDMGRACDDPTLIIKESGDPADRQVLILQHLSQIVRIEA